MVYLEIALQIVTFLACLSFLEALYSLAGVLRYHRLLREAANRPPGCFAPPVSLILPCRREDTGLQENLHAYFRQDYPDFQILFVMDHPADPSASVFRRVAQNYPDRPRRLLFSGSSRIRGQKVHNLLHALEHVRESDQILVFGDSDIHPSLDWLRYLVAPLEDAKVGVSTGYRWYLSERWCPAASLCSAWNAGTASLMQERNSSFA